MMSVEDLIRHAADVLEMLDEHNVDPSNACIVMSIAIGTILREPKGRKEFLGQLEGAWMALDKLRGGLNA